jgi:hypothetical protein
MQDRPDAAEAVTAVATHLREQLLPKLSGADAYSVRVCANLLRIVGREVGETPERAERERARLAGLVGDGDLADQTRRLATAIREGSIDPLDAALLEHLKVTARERLEVANPRYLGSFDTPNQIVDSSTEKSN